MLRGEFLGRQSGPGSEVAGARAYEAGDDSRWIDWNLTARSIAPQIRTTEADRELQTWTVVDRSASMSFGTAEREKSEVAFAAAAAFGFLTARHGNRFGMLVAGGDFVAAARADLDPARAARDALEVVRRSPPHATSRWRSRSRVGVADARAGPPAPGPGHRDLRLPRRHRLATARSPASRTQQMLCVQVVDPRELALPAAGDADAGRHRDRSQPPRAVELGPRCASATPAAARNATSTIAAGSATPAASTSCCSPTPTG